MVRSLKIMRAYKVARQRRPMSPDQYQSALKAALDAVPGLRGYHWRKTFCKRGDASVSIIVLLGRLLHPHLQFRHPPFSRFDRLPVSEQIANAPCDDVKAGFKPQL